MKKHKITFEYWKTFDEDNTPPKDKLLFVSEDGEFWFYASFQSTPIGDCFVSHPMYCYGEGWEELDACSNVLEEISFWALPPSIKRE